MVSERISPPESEVEIMQQLALEERNTITTTADQSFKPRRTTIASFASQDGPQMTSTPEANRQNSESDASFNAMLKRYSAAVTKENRPIRHSMPVGNWQTHTMPSSVGSSQTSDLAVVVAMNYEVVSDDATINAENIVHKKMHFQAMKEIMTTIAAQKGLDSQAFRCAGCEAPVGIIFGMARTCYYTGQYYCRECHLQELRVIPARVLFNWDFKRYQGSCEFLDNIEYQPILDISEINNDLYTYVSDLAQCRTYRTQLYHLKGYLLTCTYTEATQKIFKKLTDAHLYEKIHVYSLKNLMELQSGQLLSELLKTIRKGIKHVKKCPLCCQKGFVCEICQSPSVIYPFQLDETHQCTKCKALYHKKCKPSAGCPKCKRLEKRKHLFDDTSQFHTGTDT